MRNEAELIDQFIAALLDNPTAPAPVGIDAGLAQFIRKLVSSQSVNGALDDVQSRVWKKAYIAAQAINYQQNSLNKRQPMTQKVIHSVPGMNTRLANQLTFLTTSIIGLVLFAALLTYFAGKTPNNIGANAVSPTPTIIPSSTPLPTALPAQPESPTGTLLSAPETIATIVPTVVPPDSTALMPSIGNSAAGETLTANRVITGHLTEQNPQAVYNIAVDADGMLNVVATSSDFDVSLSFSVQQPSTANGGGGGGGGGSSGGGDVPRAELFSYITAGSVTTVTVNSILPSETGEFTLGVFLSEPTQLFDDQSVKGQMDNNAASPQQFQYYTFAGNPGDLVSLSVESDGLIDLAMTVEELTTPQGYSSTLMNDVIDGCSDFDKLTCSDNDSGKGTDPELTNMLIRRKNMFAVYVRPKALLSAGNYTITLTRQTPKVVDANTTQAILLSSRLKAGAVVVNVKAGQPITIGTRLVSGVSRIPVKITFLQNGQSLSVIRLSNTEPTQQKITPSADGDLQIIAEYDGDLMASVVTEVEVKLK